MTMRFSLSYSTDLEDKLAVKSYLGHYANEPMPKERGSYEADRGWDALFADFANARERVRARAGATAHDREQQIRQTNGSFQPDIQQPTRSEGSHLQKP